MTRSPKSIAALAAITAAASLTLAACTTEADEIAEVPIEESTVIDADAAGVGVPNPHGDASPATARPDDVAGAADGEIGSGAVPPRPILDNEGDVDGPATDQ